ncbi:MAG: gliding motility-associated C-terminal domain-containing protein [Crocinitomicaceae bacterium]|nr:gliding motility-associated C-terminal domain-containing protein [Crocinitomicaceae bacterium]
MPNLLLLLAFTFFAFLTCAQSIFCPNIDAGPNQTLSCSQPCANLNASFLDLKQTDSYIVESIPHVPPIAYDQAGGMGVSVNIDDVYSNVITLPFPFCFYGVTYNSLIIGSNGNINFNTASAGGPCAWQFNANCPSPALTGLGNIFGIYHDIDPSVCGNINWYLIGTAPCQKLVVSFDEICQYSCTSVKSRHMMVLYETSNFIDVYVESKPLCASWNSGNAIIGIQDPTGANGITAPNRNTTPTWTVTNPEGWRFKPNGAPMYTFEWTDGANIIDTVPSINVCPSVATTYYSNITYTRCDGLVINESDSLTITPSPSNNITVTQINNTNSTCGQANGSLEIIGTGGTAPYTYSIDSVNYSNSGLFSNLAAGSYTFFVQDSVGCIQVFNATIIDLSNLSTSVSNLLNVSCFGFNDGSISLSSSGGTAPYSYSINQSTPQISNQFDSLYSGNYQITISDSNGCVFILDTIIDQPQAIVASFDSVASVLCHGGASGYIELIHAGGNAPFSYTINGNTSQNSSIFSNLSAGYHNITITDSSGCTTQIDTNLYQPIPIQTIVKTQDISCFGDSTGTITVTASNGNAPYTYSINGSLPQNSGQLVSLSAGAYQIIVTDSNGCTLIIDTTLNEPPALAGTISIDQDICEGDNADITTSASGGTPPYTFLWNNNATNQSINVSPPSTSIFSVIISDSNGCPYLDSCTINVTPFPVIDVIASPISGNSPLTVIFNNNTLNANSYVWDFGNGQTLTTTSTSQESSVYLQVGVYNVELTASNGPCEEKWYQDIEVIPYEELEIEVPNVFSPDNNGSNDTYLINLKNAVSINAIIVNRWGNKMAELKNLTDVWDGQINGAPAEEGVYFISYTVEGLNGEQISGHTFFHLIR